jgi:hypothetical protein
MHEIAVRRAGLRFPGVCPACGAGAAVPIRIEKAFEYWEDEERRERLVVHSILFCEACADQHAGESRKASWVEWTRRLFSEPGMALGAIVVGGVGLAFLRDALEKLSLLVFALACFPLGISYWLWRQSWNRKPSAFLAPSTSVSSQVDFSDVASEAFEPEWIRFGARREDYAAAFRAANAERLWDPGGGEAVAARQKRAWREKRNRWLIWGLAAAVVLLAVLSSLFGWDS